MKVLCVCIGGMVRSVCFKQVLNGRHGCDALAASAIWNDGETMRTLCRWADRIVVVEPRSLPKGPDEYRDRWAMSTIWDAEFAPKRRVVNLGPDVWGMACHPDLIERCEGFVAEVLA